MKASITSTDQIVDVDALPAHPDDAKKRIKARVWEGITEAGVKFTAYIPLVQVASKDDNTQFERELSEHKRPEDWTQRAIDMRFIL